MYQEETPERGQSLARRRSSRLSPAFGRIQGLRINFAESNTDQEEEGKQQEVEPPLDMAQVRLAVRQRAFETSLKDRPAAKATRLGHPRRIGVLRRAPA